MAKWKVRDEDARMLLGGVLNGQFYEIKKRHERVLDVDWLTRISYLVGIFKALNILYLEALADAWIRLPNANRLFGGQTALAFMIKGGLPAMQTVRRLRRAAGRRVILPPTALVRQNDTRTALLHRNRATVAIMC